ARFSLPTRVPFIVACSNAPMVVLGSARTAVAKFVTRFGLGVVSGYEAASFREAMARVDRSEEQRRMRANAAAMAESFRDDGAREWIWASLAKGEAIDLRFERLLPPDPSEFAYFVERPVSEHVFRDFRPVYRALDRLRQRGFQPDFVVDVGSSTGVWSHA